MPDILDQWLSSSAPAQAPAGGDILDHWLSQSATPPPQQASAYQTNIPSFYPGEGDQTPPTPTANGTAGQIIDQTMQPPPSIPQAPYNAYQEQQQASQVPQMGLGSAPMPAPPRQLTGNMPPPQQPPPLGDVSPIFNDPQALAQYKQDQQRIKAADEERVYWQNKPAFSTAPRYNLVSKDEFDAAMQPDVFVANGMKSALEDLYYAKDGNGNFVDRPESEKHPLYFMTPDGRVAVREEIYNTMRAARPSNVPPQTVTEDLKNVPAQVSAAGAEGLAGLSQAAGQAVNYPGHVLNELGRMFPNKPNSQSQPQIGPTQPSAIQQAGQSLNQFGDYLGKGAETLQQDNPVRGEVGKLATGMGTLAIDQAMGAMLGPEAFMASFAARNAGTMYRQSIQQNPIDPGTAFAKAMTAGFTAALTPKLAHMLGPEATQEITEQVVRSYIGTGSMVAAQATLDELTLKAGTDQKIDLSRVFPEAATQGLIGVAMHGVGMAANRERPNTENSNAARNLQSPADRSNVAQAQGGVTPVEPGTAEAETAPVEAGAAAQVEQRAPEGQPAPVDKLTEPTQNDALVDEPKPTTNQPAPVDQPPSVDNQPVAGQNIPVADESGAGRTPPQPQNPERPSGKEVWQMTRAEYAREGGAQSKSQEAGLRKVLQFNPMTESGDFESVLKSRGAKIISTDDIGSFGRPSGAMGEVRQVEYTLDGSRKFAYLLNEQTDVDSAGQASLISDRKLSFDEAVEEYEQRAKQFNEEYPKLLARYPMEAAHPDRVFRAVADGKPVPDHVFAEAISGDRISPSGLAIGYSEGRFSGPVGKWHQGPPTRLTESHFKLLSDAVRAEQDRYRPVPGKPRSSEIPSEKEVNAALEKIQPFERSAPKSGGDSARTSPPVPNPAAESAVAGAGAGEADRHTPEDVHQALVDAGSTPEQATATVEKLGTTSEDRHTPQAVRDALVAAGSDPAKAEETVAKLQGESDAATQGQQPSNSENERAGNDQGGASKSSELGRSLPTGEYVGGAKQPAKDNAAKTKPVESLSDSDLTKEMSGGATGGRLSKLINERMRREREGPEEIRTVEPELPPTKFAPTDQPSAVPKLSRDKRPGYVSMQPDFKRMAGQVGTLRSRFASIAASDSPELASALTKHVNSGTEAKNTIAAFERKAFAGVKDKEQALEDFRAIGWNNRAKEMKSRGLPATGVPTLTAAEEAAIRAKPEFQKAIKLWNDEIAPKITDIRARNRMMMNKNAGKYDLWLNLPTEGTPSGEAMSSANLGPAFNSAAAGEGDYKIDPHETLVSSLRGHLRTDASREVLAAVRNGVSVDPATVKDPHAKRDPAQWEKQREGGDWFVAKVKGHLEQVKAWDFNENGAAGIKKFFKDANGDTQVYFPPELHYVPKRVYEVLADAHQSNGSTDTPYDKVLSAFTRIGLVGHAMGHALRVVQQATGRVGQSGQSVASAVPWIGSVPATIVRLAQMGRSALGETMQMLVDRTGSDRGVGFGIKEAKSLPARILDIPHKALMDPEGGLDPRARRVVADSHIRMELGNKFMDDLEGKIKAGTVNPSEAAAQIEKKLGADGMMALGKRVNDTLGYSNPQTRSGLMNHAQRIALPFIGVESGMIPDEIRKVLTLNLNPKAIAKNVARGEYGRAALQVATQLATGPVGTYLMMQALNYATSGQPMDRNDEGHKLDVKVGEGWYLSNLDPTFDRAMRILGGKAVANKDEPHAGKELLNEVGVAINPALRTIFTAGSGAAPHITEGKNLMAARAGWWWPAGLGQKIIQSIGDGKGAGPGVAQELTNFLTGARLADSSSKNYTDAERLAHKLSQTHVPELSDEERAHHKDRMALLGNLRAAKPEARTAILDQAVKNKTILPEQGEEIMGEVHRTPFQDLIHGPGMTAESAMKVWDAATPFQKREIEVAVRMKVARSKTMEPDDKKANMAKINAYFKEHGRKDAPTPP